MINIYLFLFSYILFLAEGRNPAYTLYKRNRNGESYLEVYSCNHPKNNHLHIFSHKKPQFQNKDFPPSYNEQQEEEENNLESAAVNETDGAIGNRIFYFGGKRAKLSRQFKAIDLKYNLCNEKSTDLIKITKMKLLNDPIFPGDIHVAFDGVLKEDLSGAVKIEVEAYKQILGLDVLMPCFEGVGSCVYENACEMSHYEPPCPEDFQRDGIPCTCPISKGRYRSNNLKVYAGATEMLNFPSWLTDGVYKIKVTASANGKRLTCLSGEGTMEQLFNNSK